MKKVCWQIQTNLALLVITLYSVLNIKLLSYSHVSKHTIEYKMNIKKGNFYLHKTFTPKLYPFDVFIKCSEKKHRINNESFYFLPYNY